MGLSLLHLPERTAKPRNAGLTMVMDKGLSLRQAEDLVSMSSASIDFIKLGFGTSLVTPCLKEKIKLYEAAGIQPYLGGTLFEAALIRNQLQDYVAFCKSLNLKVIEVSDGSIQMNHIEKCNIIKSLSADFKILSEVGSKEVGVIIHPSRWIKMMSSELEAGAFKVIAEARESGTVGIFHKNQKNHIKHQICSFFCSFCCFYLNILHITIWSVRLNVISSTISQYFGDMQIGRAHV